MASGGISSPLSMDIDQPPSMSSMSIVDSTDDRPVFVDQDNAQRRWACPLCKRTLLKPVQTICGQRVCRDCIFDKFTANKEKIDCPFNHEDDEFGDDLDCRNGLSKNDIHQDPGALRQMQKEKVYCTYHGFGCKEIMIWKKLKEHITHCQFAPVNCDNPGCNQPVAKCNLEEHKKQCGFAEVDCKYCSKHMLKRELQDHVEESCPSAVKNCEECKLSFSKRIHYNVHRQIGCVQTGGSCYYQRFGCQFKSKDKRSLRQHYEKESNRHLEMTTMFVAEVEKAVNTAQKQQSDKNNATPAALDDNYKKKHRQLEKFMGNMNTTLIKLKNEMEQKLVESAGGVDMTAVNDASNAVDDVKRRMRTLEERVGTTGPEIPSTLASHSRSIQLHDIRLAEYDNRLKSLEQASYEGELYWKIGNYKRRKEDAVRGRSLSIYSHPFYSGKPGAPGYKMCGRIYLNGDGIGKGKCISLFFVVMKGEFDEQLDWPFSRKVTFSLLAPGRRDSHKTETFMPDPESTSFKRPTTDMNIASGCPQFVRIDEVESDLFLKNDCIYISIKVEKGGANV